MRHGILAALLIGMGVLIGAAPMVGQEQDEATPPESRLKDMMEGYARSASPGPEHERLEALVGHWDLKGRFRMGPDSPWTNFHGIAENEWILGGRFLTSKILGGATEWMPRPYEGFGITGFDRFKHKYVTLGLENYSTAMHFMEGTYAEATKTITLDGTVIEAATGEEKRMKSTLTIEGRERHIHRNYALGPNGKEFMSVEIIQTRRKR